MAGIGIGAGTEVLIGTGTAPNNAAHGGSASDADLTNQNAWLKDFSLTQTQGTVDITCLNADVNGYNKQFISSLADAKVSANYIDSAAMTNYLILDGLRKNTASEVGRGAFDVILLVGGVKTGNAKVSFTMLLDSLPFAIATEAAFGGAISGQITGAVTVTAQS